MRAGTHFTVEQREHLVVMAKLRPPMTDETKAKIAVAKTGIPRPQSVLDALRNANLGRPLSEEHRAALSAAGKGKPKSAEWRANMSIAQRGHIMPETARVALLATHLGKDLSDATRAKMSESRKGELNPAWAGGVTPIYAVIRHSEEYVQWRTMVFIRDGHICRKCHKKNQKLKAHHMDCFSDFPEKRMDINNGIAFCESCHIEFHHRYGVRHNRKWQTDEFLYGGLDD